MACVCPFNTFNVGEIVDHYYCVVASCSANGTSYKKQYWVNKSYMCEDTTPPGQIHYVDCDQLAGCCA